MRDPRVEQWLDSNKVSYNYVDALRIDMLLVESDDKLNIRMTESIDQEAVMRYAMSLEAGITLPGIVVYRDRKNYRLINGWHRTEAFKLALRTVLPAYIVEVDDLVIVDRLRRTANLIEGKPLTADEAVQHALHLVSMGQTPSDAARLMMLKEGRLREAIAERKVRERLSTVGVDPKSLSKTVLVRLSGVQSDAHLGDIIKLSLEARLGADDVTELGKQIRDAQTDAERETVLAEWRDRFADEITRTSGGKVKNPSSNIRRLASVTAQAQRILDKSSGSIKTLSAQALKVNIAACRRLVSSLNKAIAIMESELGGKTGKTR